MIGILLYFIVGALVGGWVAHEIDFPLGIVVGMAWPMCLPFLIMGGLVRLASRIWEDRI